MVLGGNKRARADQASETRELASVVRASRARMAVTPPDPVDVILEAIETGQPPPSRARLYRGPAFEDVGDEAFDGIEYASELCNERLKKTPHGRAVLRALEGCHACDEDEAHFEGLDGEILRTIADGECESRIEVKRVLDPYNPVAFLTPPSELALAAVASEPIDAGEPIALYAGDLLSEEEEAAASMYVYELDPEELARRGYSPPAGSRFGPCLRVDASRRGSEARYINDKWGGGLPDRQPNCFVELLFDERDKRFMLVFFASRRIAIGREIIADYGPDYWQGALKGLREAHRTAR